MSLDSHATELSGWADKGGDDDAQVLLAHRLAREIRDPKLRPGLARLDLVGLAASIPPAEKRWLKSIASSLFLLPVLWTWFHLFLAVEGFGSRRSLEEQNFLTYWTGGYQNSPGGWWDLQGAALQVVGIVGIVLLFNLGISRYDSSRLEKRQIDLLRILSQCQVELSHSGSMSPRDVTDALGKSVNALETAIERAADTMGAIAASVSTIEDANRQLASSSTQLADSTSKLAAASNVLADFPVRLRDAVEGLDSVTRLLADLQRDTDKFSRSITNIQAAHESFVKTGNEVSSTQKELASRADSIVLSANQLMTTLDRVSGVMSAAAQRQDVIAQTLEQNEADVLVLARGVTALRDAILKLEDIGRSFATAAELYRDAAEGDGIPRARN